MSLVFYQVPLLVDYLLTQAKPLEDLCLMKANAKHTCPLDLMSCSWLSGQSHSFPFLNKLTDVCQFSSLSSSFLRLIPSLCCHVRAQIQHSILSIVPSLGLVMWKTLCTSRMFTMHVLSTVRCNLNVCYKQKVSNAYDANLIACSFVCICTSTLKCIETFFTHFSSCSCF